MGMIAFTSSPPPSSKGDHHQHHHHHHHRLPLSSPPCCSNHSCGSRRRSNATTLLALILAVSILGHAYFRAPFPRTTPSTTTATTTTTTSTNQAAVPTDPHLLPCPPVLHSVDSAAGTKTPDNQKKKKGAPTFVFVVGLEGTGHHLHNLLVGQSPHHVTLGQLQLHESILSVSQLLFGSMGLMTVHCLETSPNLVPVPANATDRCAKLDTQCLYRELVKELQHIHSVVTTSQTDPSLLVYVNTNSIMKTSMGSYPSFQHLCRPLQYPILDLYYDACEDAGVDCRHVYLYRDPYAALQSSLRRNFNKGPLSAMQLYTTMLLVLQAQFHNRPDRVIGCIGLYEGQGLNRTNTHDWKSLQHLLGYNDDNNDAFQQSVQAIYKPPIPLSDDARKTLIPPAYQHYMGPYIRAYDTMLQLCREQVTIHTASKTKCSTTTTESN